MPTVIPNSSGLMQVGGEQMQIKREPHTSNPATSTLNKVAPAPAASRPVSVLTPRPPPVPTPRRSSSDSDHMNAMSRDSDVGHVNKVCNHKLKFISNITYACINW